MHLLLVIKTYYISYVCSFSAENHFFRFSTRILEYVWENTTYHNLKVDIINFQINFRNLKSVHIWQRYAIISI